MDTAVVPSIRVWICEFPKPSVRGGNDGGPGMGHGSAGCCVPTEAASGGIQGGGDGRMKCRVLKLDFGVLFQVASDARSCSVPNVEIPLPEPLSRPLIYLNPLDL